MSMIIALKENPGVKDSYIFHLNQKNKNYTIKELKWKHKYINYNKITTLEKH